MNEPPNSTTTLFTIGHSNHQADDFFALLQTYQIQTLVDIRRFPQSKKYPRFDLEALEESLPRNGITYHWLEALGGWRKGLAEQSPNRGLEILGYRHYADYMLTKPFIHAVGQLITIAKLRTSAIMCAEKNPPHCHRIILSDYLVAQGMDVIHIVDLEKRIKHQLNPLAMITPEREVLYPKPAVPLQGTLFDVS